MKQEVKEKWITALRSGDYVQGFGTLKTIDNKHCCLGVLCDIYHKETGEGKWKNHDFNDGIFFNINSKSESVQLPTEVQKWADIDGPTPYVIVNSFERPLSNVNDEGISNSIGASFEIIADIIEKQL